MSRLLPPRKGSRWMQISSHGVSRQTCRCVSQFGGGGKVASPYRHGGAGEKEVVSLPGLPEELVGRADLEKKTISTPVGDLPMSPLMDPAFHEAKMRYKMPKAPESSVYKKVKWRRQLDRNPWAHALATDIRRCPATATTIPKFFLQDFNFVSHPETGKPWYVPTSLAPSHPRQSPEHQQDTTNETDADQQPPDPTTSNSPEAESKPATTKPSKPPGPTSYMLARQDLIACQGIKDKRYPQSQGYKKLLVLHHSLRSHASALKGAVWREDMGSLVLELMRRRVVEDLVYYAGLSGDAARNAYVVRCDAWGDVTRPEYNGHRGCVLWFGEGEGEGPGPRAIMDVPGVRFGGKIPVHNMRRLLGEEHIARLKGEAGVFREGCLFVVMRGRTMELQLKLWKLQGFLAHPFEKVGETKGTGEGRRVEEYEEE